MRNHQLLTWLTVFALVFPLTAPSHPKNFSDEITLVPAEMTLSGDVATVSNSSGYCTESWFAGMPPGSILLGVDPTSCAPQDWDGAIASGTIFLPAPYSPTLYVIKISWPNMAGKGLHSPLKNVSAQITFDGKTLWSKRTTQPGTSNNDYYGAEHEAIITTLVVRQAGSHTFTIHVPAHTAWDISSIKFTASPLPTGIHGIGYSPYLDCQTPGGKIQPTLQNVENDLEQLIHTTNAIRTYSSTGINAQVPALANSLDLPIFAGAWLDHNANDAIEIQGLIQLAQSNSLAGVIVGNEYYLRHRSSANIDLLRQAILQVKSSIPANIPVATAEIDSLMFSWNGTVPTINPAYRPILDELDIILVHIYPFWNGMPIENAADFTVNHYKAIQALIETEYPLQGKRVIIGETGWPSGGSVLGQAVPSLSNQKRYLQEFLALTKTRNVEFFYFDAYDELWKIEEAGHVGQNWGYGYSDRSAKHAFFGVLIPPGELFPQQIYLPLIANIFGIQPSPQSPAKHLFSPLKMRQSLSSFVVYDEWPEETGHFVPSGWMGDIEQVDMYGCDRTDPLSGEMALRASFSASGALGWAGVYWQYPENNWGNLPDGLNLSAMNKLTFWAKGAQGGEKIKFFVGGIGSASDSYPDSLRPEVSTGYVQLSTNWQQFTINLTGSDLSHLIGGFGWATDRCANPQGATFFLDNVQFEYDPALLPPPPPGPVFPVYTDAAAPNNHFSPSGWVGDAQTPGRVSLTECWSNSPYSGQTSIRIAYTQKVIGWAGVYWLTPNGNWGDHPGGINLAGVKRLTFWARSDTPGAAVKFFIGGVGYALDSNGYPICSAPLYAYPDSVCPKIEQFATLNTTWTKYSIDLSGIPINNLTSVVGGFGWSAETPIVFYLDDIVYEFE